MGKWSDLEWGKREATLGDPAEHRFREWASEQGISYVKYGLDRPPINLSRVPAFVRYTPDFLTGDGLYEVQGCGQDGMFKFKHDKLDALCEWKKDINLWLWLWNKSTDWIAIVPIETIVTMCMDPVSGDWDTDGLFDGSKPFAAVRCEELGYGVQ